MEIKVGDWVRIPTGQTGRVVRIARLSAYIDVKAPIGAHLTAASLNELEKIDPPDEPDQFDQPWLQT
jgi:hypothetical protein